MPTPVPGITKRIVRVYAGLDYTYALAEDGEWFSWGYGEKWQLGNRERDVKLRPVLCKIRGEKVVDFALGGASAFALCGSSSSSSLSLSSPSPDSGHLYSWGEGMNGRLGHGDAEDQPIPLRLDLLSGPDTQITQIASRGGHTLALDSNGTVWAWGLGRGGRLGLGGEEDHYVPTPISALKGQRAVMVATGVDHSIVVCRDE